MNTSFVNHRIANSIRVKSYMSDMSKSFGSLTDTNDSDCHGFGSFSIQVTSAYTKPLGKHSSSLVLSVVTFFFLMGSMFLRLRSQLFVISLIYWFCGLLLLLLFLFLSFSFAVADFVFTDIRNKRCMTNILCWSDLRS